ncbi:MAG: hypothetical protein IH924_08885 [Proteobacteria bacterium]|nr:hypothetical protein [Pseudomonadota bacterium]
MTHRHAQLLLAFVLLAYFGPPLLRGEVIFVHDNRIEMGVPESLTSPDAGFAFELQTSGGRAALIVDII